MEKFNCYAKKENYFIVRESLTTGEYIKLAGGFTDYDKAKKVYNEYITRPDYDAWMKATPNCSEVKIVVITLNIKEIESIY